MATSIAHGDYKLKDPDRVPTPALLVFEDVVDHNIRALCDLVGAGNACPHVKTHKSLVVVRKMLAEGISVFKGATLRELEMILEAGSKDAILAYPLIQPVKLERFAATCRDNPDASLHATVSLPAHVEALGRAARDAGLVLNAMMDVDTGFHRTGIDPGRDAVELYRAIAAHPNLEPTGLHAYDGHDHSSDPGEREQEAAAHIEDVKRLRDELLAGGDPVPRVVAGGSYSFLYYAREDGMLGSPGTFAYWDFGYGGGLPDLPFKPAALILAQVVDRHPNEGTATIDLGTKSIAAEIPTDVRARLMGHEVARLKQQSEEHGVFTFPSGAPEAGEYLFAVPGHICPCIIRYPGAHVVNIDGDITDFWEHTARDR